MDLDGVLLEGLDPRPFDYLEGLNPSPFDRNKDVKGSKWQDESRGVRTTLQDPPEFTLDRPTNTLAAIDASTLKTQPLKLLDGVELDYIENFLNTFTAPSFPFLRTGDTLDECACTSERSPEGEEQERKSRHVVAEHKRKDKIRGEFNRLARLIPSLAREKGRKTQAKVIAAANQYILELRRENERLCSLLAHSRPPNR